MINFLFVRLDAGFILRKLRQFAMAKKNQIIQIALNVAMVRAINVVCGMKRQEAHNIV